MNFDQTLRLDWPARVNARDRLVWRGRHLTTTFLLQIGDQAFLVHIADGRLDSVRTGPFVLADWAFALRAPVQAWSQFWSPLPPPGFHDIMAMLKLGHLTIEGDLYPLMSNLLYFKDVLAALRQDATKP
jgi:hypothetical protein